MMFWQFSQPPFLRKASMNTELNEVLGQELQKLDYIKVLNKDVTFTNVKMGDRSIANFSATIVPTDTSISSEVLKTQVVQYLKANLDHDYDNIYEVYEINVVED